MRVLLALALFGGVAGETCPIITWLEEHGKDVFDTVMECKDLPAAFEKAHDPDCYAKPSPRDKVAMAVWYGMTALQHLNGSFPEIVKQSKLAEKIKDEATAQLIASTHKKVNMACGQPKCNDIAKTLTSVVGPCYGSVMCNFMTKYVPFAPCKDAFDTYLETVMASRLDTACESEDLDGGNKFYCSEVFADLMFKNVDCFMEYQTGGARGCTPKCVSQWQAMSSKLPKCTKAFGGQTEEVFQALRNMMVVLAKSATDPHFKKAIEHMPKTPPTYEETCNRSPDEGAYIAFASVKIMV